MYPLIWTDFSGERCGPWTPCSLINVIFWQCIVIKRCFLSNLLFRTYRNHSFHLSDSLSISVVSCLAHNIFNFEIGILYLPYGCITTRRYVTYIHDPNTKLTFDFKVKYIGFLTCLCVQPTTSVRFDIGKSYLTHGSINMWQCVAYIHDPDTTLTFIQGQICRVFDMALCSGHSFFVLWHSHTIFGTPMYHHGLLCHIHSWPLYYLDLWHQNSKLYFHHEFVSRQDLLCSLTWAFQIWHMGATP